MEYLPLITLGAGILSGLLGARFPRVARILDALPGLLGGLQKPAPPAVPADLLALLVRARANPASLTPEEQQVVGLVYHATPDADPVKV